MSTLIMLCGLPRSGKTTWARQQGHPIVSPDNIRLALHGQRFNAEAEGFVWCIAKTMVKALFLTGYSHVILDATNVTRKRREEWKSKDWKVKHKHIATPASLCRERAKDDMEMLVVIDRMVGQFEPLGVDEEAW